MPAHRDPEDTVTDEFPHGYPEHLAGAPAAPPEQVAPRTVEMAVRAHERARAAAPPLLTAAPWRTAAAVDRLFAEVNAAHPTRAKASDGRKGDAKHEKLGKGTDHNAWLIHQGTGIVRAGDITNDPAIDLPAAFERARALAAAGKLPQLLNGGYLILNGRITAPDFTHWREYTGSNPHVSHGHVSVSLNPAQFDTDRPWGIFTPAAAPSPAPSPAPAPVRRPQAPGWTGPDLTGRGTGLRGVRGNNGPRVAALQRFLRDNYPAYRHAFGGKLIEVDGFWGDQTTAWNRRFAHLSSIPSADGENIGPRLAAAYHRAGLFRQLSAARARAVGHVTRGARR